MSVVGDRQGLRAPSIKALREYRADVNVVNWLDDDSALHPNRRAILKLPVMAHITSQVLTKPALAPVAKPSHLILKTTPPSSTMVTGGTPMVCEIMHTVINLART